MKASEAAERSDLMARLSTLVSSEMCEFYANAPLPDLRQAVDTCEEQATFYASNFNYVGSASAR